MLANKKPTILVVDDERSVRELVRMMLEPEGIDVICIEGGRSALKFVADSQFNVDILLTDIIMPYMNGRELANRISVVRPLIKVLFFSAYSAEVLTHHNLAPDGADFIKKPFTKAVLMERISRVWASSPKWTELVHKRP